MSYQFSFSAFKKDDTVIFNHPSFMKYDKDGGDVFKNLNDLQHYIVEDVYILSLKLKGVEGIFLKENFQKIIK